MILTRWIGVICAVQVAAKTRLKLALCPVSLPFADRVSSFMMFWKSYWSKTDEENLKHKVEFKWKPNILWEMYFEIWLQIARKALEPPDDPRESEEESELLAKAKPLQSSVPQHWSSVRAACIEGVLSTAILASRHADVWDAAALLLREHYRQESSIYDIKDKLIYLKVSLCKELIAKSWLILYDAWCNVICDVCQMLFIIILVFCYTWRDAIQFRWHVWNLVWRAC